MNKGKILFYSVLILLSAIAGFLAGKINFTDGKTRVTNEAYCITLYDYMIKTVSSEKDTVQWKTNVYILKSLIKGREKVFMRYCPEYYRITITYLSLIKSDIDGRKQKAKNG
jgi:hypothetical protein